MTVSDKTIPTAQVFYVDNLKNQPWWLAEVGLNIVVILFRYLRISLFPWQKSLVQILEWVPDQNFHGGAFLVIGNFVANWCKRAHID